MTDAAYREKPLLKRVNRWLRSAQADERITVEWKPGVPLRGPWLVQDARHTRSRHWWEDSFAEARHRVKRLIANDPAIEADIRRARGEI